MDKIYTSSTHGDWETPKEMVEKLNPFFLWDLDACADRPNICSNYFSRDDNSLSRQWGPGLIYCNPPYSKKRGINLWIEKARKEGAKEGTTVVCLLPARTGTHWWHDNIPYADYIVFIEGRLRFDLPGGKEAPYSAGFPSALVVFGKLVTAQRLVLSTYGWALEMANRKNACRSTLTTFSQECVYG